MSLPFDGRPASSLRLTLVGLALATMAAGSGLLATATALGPERDRLIAMAPAGGEIVREEAAIRGTITDRNGVILAVTVTRYRLVRDRLLSSAEVDAAVETLAPLLGDDAALRSRIADTTSIYITLTDTLSETDGEAVRAALDELAIFGLRLEPVRIRLYPQPGGGEGTTLASTLLGFVNRDGEGQYGIEGALDAALAGSPAIFREMRTTTGGAVPGSRETLDPGVLGAPVTLTIDAPLQAALETLAERATEKNEARAAYALIMDADTGELLALAGSPGFDANRYREVAGDMSRFGLVAASEIYAPGSVMKSITAAAAIEAGVATPDTLVEDSYALSLDGGRARVRNWDLRAMGTIPLRDALAYSRNVATSRLAMLLGSDTAERAAALYAAWQRLGLTGPTGTDLPGEAAGLSRDPADARWAEIDLANASFGQGVSVSGLQLAAAYGALINGGILTRPQVARQIGEEEHPVVSRGAAISGDTSSTMRSLLRYVMEERYRDMLVPGYLVGGKTGTAEVWDAERGDWSTDRLDFSLFGFVEDATGHRYVIAVAIRDAINWARGTYALPYRTALFFRDAVRAVGRTLDLPRIKTKRGALWHQEDDPNDVRRLPVGETGP